MSKLTLLLRLRIAFETLFTCSHEKELPVFMRGYDAGRKDEILEQRTKP